MFPMRYELNLYTLLVVGVLAIERRYITFPVRYELNLYTLCRRK
jgi:hypothetical protein